LNRRVLNLHIIWKGAFFSSVLFDKLI
jgi:hypothetical protein